MNEEGLIARLVTESDAMRVAVGPLGLAVAAASVVAALLITRAARGVVRLVWRLGFDRRRRLGQWDTAIKAVVWTAVALVVVDRLFMGAPLLFSMGLAVTLPVLLIVLSDHVQNLWAGFGLVIRKRVAQGDRIRVAEKTGTVVEVGLSRIDLRADDGSTHYVPNRLLSKHIVTVEQAENSVPVAAEAPLPASRPHDLFETIRRAATLSPYRVAGSAVDVREVSGATPRVRVEIQIWSERALHEATAQLAAMLSELSPQKDDKPTP